MLKIQFAMLKTTPPSILRFNDQLFSSAAFYITSFLTKLLSRRMKTLGLMTCHPDENEDDQVIASKQLDLAFLQHEYCGPITREGRVERIQR